MSVTARFLVVLSAAVLLGGAAVGAMLFARQSDGAPPASIASLQQNDGLAVDLAAAKPRPVQPKVKKPAKPANKRANGKVKKKTFTNSRKSGSYKTAKKNAKTATAKKTKGKKTAAKKRPVRKNQNRKVKNQSNVRQTSKAKGYARVAHDRRVNYTQDAIKTRSIPKFAANKLPKHFNDHGLAMRARNQSAYQQQAMKFMTGKPPRGTLQAKRKNGDIIRYNPKNKHYGVITKDGRLKTYFKWSRTGERRVDGTWRRPNHNFKSGTEYFKHKASMP